MERILLSTYRDGELLKGIKRVSGEDVALRKRQSINQIKFI